MRRLGPFGPRVEPTIRRAAATPGRRPEPPGRWAGTPVSLPGDPRTRGSSPPPSAPPSGARQGSPGRAPACRSASRGSCRPSVTKRRRGSTWPKRSITPRTPKSGDAVERTAPIEAAARRTTMASGTFGEQDRDAVAGADSRVAHGLGDARSVVVQLAQLTTRRAPSSDQAMMAGSSVRRRRRFSAKLRRASGK